MAAGAVYREFIYTGIYGKIEFSRCLIFFSRFLVKYGIPEVREVSRNLPGGRGFALAEYGPMASHGDPIQPHNYRFFEVPNSLHLHCKAFAPQKLIMWT